MYYGFISKDGNNYNLTIEYGSLTDSPYDNSFVIDKKPNLSKSQVNSIISKDTLGTKFFYQGTRISSLY